MDYRNTERYLEGAVIFIDKPLTWTSFDVVNKVRKSLRYYLGIQKIKVGHAGTLDPLATGLVIVCTGKATKQIIKYQEMDKEYTATIRLGATTPSCDLETEVDRTYPWQHISREMAQEAFLAFTGVQVQTPPVFSAKSVEGKRAYDLARKGKDVKLRQQLITIYGLEIISFDPPDLAVRVECSKGTYIRSFARDLGQKLDSGGHLITLRRTRIGPHLATDAISPENFEENLKLL